MKKRNLSATLFSALLGALVAACGGGSQPDGGTQPQGVCTVPTTDGTSLYAIQDMPQVMPAELFGPIADSLLASAFTNGVAEASINVFYLQQPDGHILFDAGMGTRQGGQLLARLDSLNVSPADITDICVTHLHYDHVGGLFTPDGDAAFPHATLHISRAEYEAYTTGVLSDENGLVEHLAQCYQDRLHLFTPGDTLCGTIATLSAPGHTPGHTAYKVGGVLVVGDILHATSLQVTHPEYCTRFDHDTALAVSTRRAFLDQARDRHTLLAGMHFPFPGTIQF